MSFLAEIDYQTSEFVEFYEELPLWSARFAFSLLDRAPLRPNQTILDVGAGTGFLSIELAQRCRNATVVAVDPWKAAIDRLNGRISYLGLTNVRTIVNDASNVDLLDASVDLIVSNLGINNFADPTAVLRTLSRVARPGATLLMTTNLIGHMAEFYEVFRQVLIECSLQSRLAALDEHVAHRATLSSIKDLFATTGFEFVTAETSTFQDRYSDGSAFLHHFFTRLAFIQSWKAIVPPGRAEFVFTLLEQRLNECGATHGGLTLTIPAACVEARKQLRR